MCRGQVGGWSKHWVVKWVGVKRVCGPSVCVWSKCVAKVCVCVCGLSVCRDQVGGWIKWVGGQVGGGQVGVCPKYVHVVKV